MEIMTNSGKTFEASWVLEPETRNGVQQLTIQLPVDIDPAEIISELVGVAQIIGIKDNGNRTMYEHYTLFRSLIVTPDRSAQRLTLERSDEG